MAHGAPRRDVPSLAPRAMAQYGARLEEHQPQYVLICDKGTHECIRRISINEIGKSRD
ncbi:hypothetical protein Bca4012_090757 [Brassica carinata]